MSSAIKSKKRGRPVEGPSIAAEIEMALAKKRALDTELLNVERQIYALETSYLENTAALGDLIRGWGDFTTPTSPGGPGGSTMTKKKKKIHDSERIFSSSSVSAQKNPEFQSFNSGGASHSANPGMGARQLSMATGMDEDGEEAESMGFYMDIDATPIKRKSEKKSDKKRASAPRTNPKPPKLSTGTSLLGTEGDSLDLAPPETIFDQ